MVDILVCPDCEQCYVPVVLANAAAIPGHCNPRNGQWCPSSGRPPVREVYP